jgi:ferredoxin
VSAPRDERVTHGLRLCIDRSLCVGFGDCVDAAPEAFQLDDENIVILIDPERVDRDRLLKACDACPVDAITVWDVNGEQLVP